jgi:cobalt-zinc-cadmium efflux system outer membrane protein
MHFRIALIAACAVPLLPVAAQTPISRADAIRTALDRSPRLAVARTDTAVANAALTVARVHPNPSLTGSYSKSVPTHHVNLDIPIEFPMMRQLRIRSAQVGVEAARMKFLFDRAMIAMEVDTAYTRARAAREHLALSQRTALETDSLLRMVIRRRDAGDASEMDVALARVVAGQAANTVASDSLTAISNLLDLQATLGMTSDRIELFTIDSLGDPPSAATPVARSLDVEAATLSLESASLNAQTQRRSIWSQFSLALGFEYGDADQPGLLPTFGLGIGLPLFDRNRGGIAQADAERARAQATLTLAQVEARNALSHALRERANAIAKVERDRAVVASANQVAVMALTAYREGASTIANVLEARRSARDLLSQYIDDLAAAWIATAELRVFSLTPTSAP